MTVLPAANHLVKQIIENKAYGELDTLPVPRLG